MPLPLKKTGYTFVEVLVAISILLISIVGPLTIASTGLKNAAFAREQNVAFFLAQEGIEGVVYLREYAGLQDLAGNPGGTWSWVSAIPAACRNGSPCRIEIDTHTITECDPVAECDLSLFETGTYRYRHGSGGADTSYSRKLYFTELSANVLEVRSIVEWEGQSIAEEQVALRTYLYDIYEN